MATSATALNGPTNLITLAWTNIVGHSAVCVASAPTSQGHVLRGVVAWSMRTALFNLSLQLVSLSTSNVRGGLSVQNARYSFSASAVGVIGPASLSGVQRSLVQCSANGFCNQFSGQCDCNAGFGMWSSAARSCASCALWQRGWLRARALAPTLQAGWLAVTSHEQSLASCEQGRSRSTHPLRCPRF
jgi:hypothetical protein